MVLPTRQILNNIDLAVRGGEWIAVMGPSGSGKSTLLMCAAGLLRPSHGSVLLNDRDTKRIGERRLTSMRRQEIGFVFQDYNLLSALTVRDNVCLPRIYGNDVPTEGEVRDVLESVGLEGRDHELPDNLSGGEQQRVAIARALLTRPAVLFADEPTGALDSRSGQVVMNLLNKVNDLGFTVLMVTHDAFVASHAARVIWLADGIIEQSFEGLSPQELFAQLSLLEGQVG